MALPAAVPGSDGTSSPSSLIHVLASPLDRLDCRLLFGDARPVEVELGSGDGGFLMAYAALWPDRGFVGIERLRGRLRKLDRKGRRAGLVNIRGLRIEAGYALEYLLPLGGVRALHVYFPDPWPKRRHAERRLVRARFPALAAQVLVPGGHVYLRTDDRSYYQQMQDVFAASAVFEPMETPAELAAVVTDFEREFNAHGVPTLRAAFRHRPLKRQ